MCTSRLQAAVQKTARTPPEPAAGGAWRSIPSLSTGWSPAIVDKSRKNRPHQALYEIRPPRRRPRSCWPAAMCTQLVHSLAHVVCGQSCAYPPGQIVHLSQLSPSIAWQTAQKTARHLQTAPHMACSKGSRGYPQPHTAQRCITSAALYENRTILCKPRGTMDAALYPRLVHRRVHGKRGQL